MPRMEIHIGDEAMNPRRWVKGEILIRGQRDEGLLEEPGDSRDHCRRWLRTVIWVTSTATATSCAGTYQVAADQQRR